MDGSGGRIRFPDVRDVAASYGAGQLRAIVPRAGKVGSGPDLATQLEDLFDEVWRQESFERDHPYTCGVIRDAFGRGRRAA